MVVDEPLHGFVGIVGKVFVGIQNEDPVMPRFRKILVADIVDGIDDGARQHPAVGGARDFGRCIAALHVDDDALGRPACGFE